MKVLVTEATGFVGRWLTVELENEGHDVVAAPLVQRSTSRKPGQSASGWLSPVPTRSSTSPASPSVPTRAAIRRARSG